MYTCMYKTCKSFQRFNEGAGQGAQIPNPYIFGAKIPDPYIFGAKIPDPYIFRGILPDLYILRMDLPLMYVQYNSQFISIYIVVFTSSSYCHCNTSHH